MSEERSEEQSKLQPESQNASQQPGQQAPQRQEQQQQQQQQQQRLHLEQLQQQLQQRANESAERGDFEEALRLFRAALEAWASERKSPPAALLESVAQCELLQDTAESRFRAVEAAQQAVELDAAWAEGHFTLGRAETAVRDFAAAAKSFERVLALEPGHEDASEELKVVRELAQRRAAKAKKHHRHEQLEAWQSRLARKVSRAKRRRRPTWTEADWQRFGLVSKDLLAFGRDAWENVTRLSLTSSSTSALESFQDFGAKYQATSTPALLVGAASHWPAMASWTFERFADEFGSAKMVCDHRYGMTMRMLDFLDYLEEQRDDSPLYLFDHRFAERRSTRRLLGEYEIPEVFLHRFPNHQPAAKPRSTATPPEAPADPANPADPSPTAHPAAEPTRDAATDLSAAATTAAAAAAAAADPFQRLSEALRPPLKWLLIGSARSGSPIHKDPLGTSAWNALLTGTKLWVLFPPTVSPEQLRPKPGQSEPESESGHHPSFPQDSAACWFLLWWRTLRERTRLWPEQQRPMEFVQRPGDVVFVPARWWHAVLNLEDTIAVTHNFCNRWNAEDVWRCTAATHPILGRHLRAAIRELWPDLHAAFLREPPKPREGDDDEVSYLEARADDLGRGIRSSNQRPMSPDDELSSSDESDEQFSSWHRSLKRLRQH